MCINRDDKPTTCCCGCTLKCGIITFGVFAALELLGAVVEMWTFPIIGSLINIAPLVALAIKPDSAGIRLWNYIWQCIALGVIIIGLVAAVIGAEFFIAMICGAASAADGDLAQDTCSNAARIPFYAAILVLIAVLVPLQVLWVRVFKAYYDELKEGGSEAEYAPVPNDEVTV